MRIIRMLIFGVLLFSGMGAISGEAPSGALLGPAVVGTNLVVDATDEALDSVRAHQSGDWLRRGTAEQRSPARQVAPRPLRSIMALVLVLAGLFGVQVLIRRSGKGGIRTSAGSLVRMVSRLRIGPRQELVVVDFHGKRLLLGVTAERIQLLEQGMPPQEDVQTGVERPESLRSGDDK